MKHPLITPTIVLSALGLLLPSVAQAAAIEYGTDGGIYLQNFDSLGSTTAAWTNGSTLTGWHWMTSAGGTSANSNPQDGDAAGGLLLSLGTDNASDRALGAQNSNNIETLFYGAQILNTTGTTLGSFSLAYTGEQWRAIGSEGRDKLTFQYQVFDTGVTDPMLASTGWNNVTDLDFNAPKFNLGSSTKLNGNLSENSASISATVAGLTWGDGQELWLRWSDNNPVNNNAAGGSLRSQMGIDDVSFSATAIPEPSSYAALFGALSLGFASCRRRRTGGA